jgi:hypothetical protein
VDAMIADNLDAIPWLRGRGCDSDDVLAEAVDAMIADYTEDANHYSDGSVVWEWYDYENPPGYAPSSIRAALHLPPHRRTAERTHHTYRTKFLGGMQFV